MIGKLKCPFCHTEIPKENTEKYTHGRRVKIHFHCDKCGNSGNRKVSLIQYSKTNKDNIAKGCKVPWGKSKKSRLLKKRKGRK